MSNRAKSAPDDPRSFLGDAMRSRSATQIVGTSTATERGTAPRAQAAGHRRNAAAAEARLSNGIHLRATSCARDPEGAKQSPPEAGPQRSGARRSPVGDPKGTRGAQITIQMLNEADSATRPMAENSIALHITPSGVAFVPRLWLHGIRPVFGCGRVSYTSDRRVAPANGCGA